MSIAKEIIAKLKLDSKDFQKGLSDTEKNILKFSASITAVGIAVSVATKATAEYREATSKAANLAGSTVEDFSALSYAASISAVEISTLSKGLRALNSPSQESQAAMQKLGVSIYDTSGKLKTQTQLLGDIADGLNTIKTPAGKAAAAVEIFGKKGFGIINMLDGGSKELKAFTEEATKMGLVFDKEAAESSHKFNDNIEKVGWSIKGLTQQVTSNIIELSNQSGVMEQVSGAIQKVTGLWMRLDSETKKTIITVGAMVTGATALILGLGGIVAAASFVGPALIAAFPIAAVVSGIVMLGMAAYKNFDQIKESLIPIQDAFIELKDIFYDTYLSIKSSFFGIKDLFSPLLSGINSIASDSDSSGKSISVLGTIAKGIFSMIAAVVMVSITPFKILYELISGNIEIMSKLGEAVSLSFAGKFEEAGAVATGAIERTRYMGEQLKNNFIEAGAAIKSAMNIQPVFETSEIEKKLDKVKTKIENTISPKAGNKVALFIGVEVDAKVDEKIKGMAAEFQATSDRFSEISTVIGNTWGKLTDYMSQKMQQSLARSNRNFEVYAGKQTQMYDRMKKETEEEENNKLKLIESKYDEQINALKIMEDRKLATISNAARERLLALDQEYIRQKEQQEQAFVVWQEQETIRYEAEQALILQKAVDKEQRQLVETIMDNDFKLYMEGKQKEHDLRMENFSKEYLSNQQSVQNAEKNSILLTQNEIKTQVEALNVEKNKALEQAEIEKNDRLEKLEAKRFEDEKQLKKMEALTNYRAEKSQLENTKALKISQTIIGGIAGAAGAFAMAASTIPIIGVIVGAALAASVLIATGISVAQLSSQTIPAPAALFLAKGGVLEGASHAQGGISANLEGGEGVLDKIRTQKMIDAADNMTSGNSYNFFFEAGAIQNEGKDIDESTMEKISYKLARMMERQGVYA